MKSQNQKEQPMTKREAIIWPKNCVTCGWHDHGGICRNPHLGVKNYCIIDNDWKPKKARNQQNRGKNEQDR